MTEQWLQAAAEHFTRPWSERRGIETLDRNAETILVRVPLNELSDGLAARAIAAHRNVMGVEIEVSSASVLAYQLVGQFWSIIVEVQASRFHRPSVLQPNGLAQISRDLEQPVIRLLISDTCCQIGYDLFEHGELVEYFRGAEENLTRDSNEHGIQPNRYEWFPSPDELEEGQDPSEPKQTAYFWSRRQVVVEDTKSIWDVVGRLLREYDAFAPAIDEKYLLGYPARLEPGKRYRVQNPGFTLMLGCDQNGRHQQVTSVPDLVSVDYFSFEM